MLPGSRPARLSARIVDVNPVRHGADCRATFRRRHVTAATPYWIVAATNRRYRCDQLLLQWEHRDGTLPRPRSGSSTAAPLDDLLGTGVRSPQPDRHRRNHQRRHVHDGLRRLGCCRARADPARPGPATLERQAALAAVGLIAAIGRETLARVAALNATGAIASSGVKVTPGVTVERSVVSATGDRNRRREPSRRSTRATGRSPPQVSRLFPAAPPSAPPPPSRGRSRNAGPYRRSHRVSADRERRPGTARPAGRARRRHQHQRVRCPGRRRCHRSTFRSPRTGSISTVGREHWHVPRPWRPAPASRPLVASCCHGPRSSPPQPRITHGRAEKLSATGGGSYGYRHGHRRRGDRGCRRRGRRCGRHSRRHRPPGSWSMSGNGPPQSRAQGRLRAFRNEPSSGPP